MPPLPPPLTFLEQLQNLPEESVNFVSTHPKPFCLLLGTLALPIFLASNLAKCTGRAILGTAKSVKTLAAFFFRNFPIIGLFGGLFVKLKEIPFIPFLYRLKEKELQNYSLLFAAVPHFLAFFISILQKSEEPYFVKNIYAQIKKGFHNITLPRTLHLSLLLVLIQILRKAPLDEAALGQLSLHALTYSRLAEMLHNSNFDSLSKGSAYFYLFLYGVINFLVLSKSKTSFTKALPTLLITHLFFITFRQIGLFFKTKPHPRRI